MDEVTLLDRDIKMFSPYDSNYRREYFFLALQLLHTNESHVNNTKTSFVKREKREKKAKDTAAMDTWDNPFPVSRTPASRNLLHIQLSKHSRSSLSQARIRLSRFLYSLLHRYVAPDTMTLDSTQQVPTKEQNDSETELSKRSSNTGGLGLGL
ncbi:hypothetical protein BDU57DRAFT_564702 [Ampelomyces quisqualis]|uniref:Uncharacterized protein n=1 Tax=Ampelomyces quisqualis TaxID=50730 RepID=A0A6A5QC52_AMPQU|nr:hypothetical protein BDU57DRAFT_564702 [Ampelomyces quisqualis]